MSPYYKVEMDAQPCRSWGIFTAISGVFLILDPRLCPYACDTPLLLHSWSSREHKALHASLLGGSATPSFTSDILQEGSTSLEVDTGLETGKEVDWGLVFCRMPGNWFCFALSRAVRHTDVKFYPSARFYYSCLHSLNSTLQAQPSCSGLSMQITHTLKTHSPTAQSLITAWMLFRG